MKNKNEIILSAQNVHKNYIMGKSLVLKVLKNINLNIMRGEILAIIGPSGVGKSTLLHILGALDRPTSGKIVLDDVNVFTMRNDQMANFRNKQVGFVFQFHHLLPEFNALENVAMPGLIHRIEKKKVYHDAKKILREVGLSDRLYHRPGELSGGELQRVAFARALANDPTLVLADEPSGNLDLKNSQALHDLMWNFVREKQKTLVIVTHDMELASKADRIVELYDGEVKDA